METVMPQAIGAAASIGGALLGASSAKKAAKAQAASAQQDLAFQTQTRDLARSDLAPWRKGGQDANAAMLFELGLGPRPTFGGTTPKIETFFAPASKGGSGGINIMNPAVALFGGGMTKSGGASRGVQQFRVNGQTFATRAEAEAFAKANATGGTEYGGYQKTPGYDFRMKTGMDALESSAAARGGLLSGAALQASQQFGQDYGSNEYGNYLARLAGMAGSGQSAAAGQAGVAQTAANGVSNALAGIGNAGAAGAIGVGNALTGGLQNLATGWQYQKAMGQPGGFNVGGNLFGGNSWG